MKQIITFLFICCLIPLAAQSAVQANFQPLSKNDLEKVIHLNGKVIEQSDSTYRLATKRRIFTLDKKGVDEMNQLDSSRVKTREIFKVKVAHIIGISNGKKK